MTNDPGLRAKLGALLAGRASERGARGRREIEAPARVRVPAAPLPGVVEQTERGPIFVHERRWTAADRGQDQVLAHLSEARERLAFDRAPLSEVGKRWRCARGRRRRRRSFAWSGGGTPFAGVTLHVVLGDAASGSRPRYSGDVDADLAREGAHRG